LNPKGNQAQARESIRQAKAEATQEGRHLKKQTKLGNKHPRNIAVSLFNGSAFMARKAVNDFSDAHKERGGSCGQN